jgi:hypothetical protein
MSRLILLASLAALSACDPGTNAVRSCGGARVLECDPYAWSSVTAASFTPEVPVGDPRVRPQIQVTLETCGATTPAAPEVQIQAIVGLDDAGNPSRIVQITTVRAASATSTSVDVTIDNPFTLGSGLPPDEDILLRFVPVVAGCDGDALEIPYRTGPVVRP